MAQQLADHPVGETTFGAPHYTFHRADLHRALTEAIPRDRIHLAHRFMRLVDYGDRVEAHFDNGQSISADALVGADGIHSAVRQALLGPEKPRFTGCVAYRGLVPADRLTYLGLEPTNQVWMGPGRHFVHYFVSGGTLVNFVAVIEEHSWLRESWVDRGEVADVLAAYAGWHPQVLSIIGSADETYKWALFDRKPLPLWSVGRVTLLGDSCHPMLPFMAQGATQAIEDAAALTGCLLKFRSNVPAAVRLYEQLRLPRASRLQGMSETNKNRFHMPDGPAQNQRDAEMASGATDWSRAAVAWLYEHECGSGKWPLMAGFLLPLRIGEASQLHALLSPYAFRHSSYPALVHAVGPVGRSAGERHRQWRTIAAGGGRPISRRRPRQP